MTDVALIFPGQGAQAVGMGKEFYDLSEQARQVFDSADEVISGLKEVVFNGPADKLTSTQFCQPGIFTFSLAAYEAFKAHEKFKEVSVKFACGLSLGECSAVAASGALGFEDALSMVERRAAFMEGACQAEPGSMAAVIGLNKDSILAICEEVGVQVANFNSPEQIVITGETAKVEAASEKIKEAGAKRVLPLSVGGAFHSELMAPAVSKFESTLNSFSFNTPEFPVISNVDGAPCDSGDGIRANLAKQITSSVQWVKTVEHMAKAGVSTFLEIGPGTVLKGLIRKIDSDLVVHNIHVPADIENLSF